MTTPLFSNFKIVDRYGITHIGIKPSSLPGPFQQVSVILKDNRELFPVLDAERNNFDIIGFDASIKIILDAHDSNIHLHLLS